MDDQGSRSDAHIFDEKAENYSAEIDEALSAYGAQHAFFTRHKARLIERLLSDAGISPADLDLVDVGCGIGAIHQLIGPKFRSLKGVDVSRESIECARRENPDHEYRSYDGHRLPFADASHDMALAICVLHHVPPTAWQHFAAEMLRILRPGGLALVIEHNPINPITRRIVMTCPIDKDAVLLSRRQTSDLFRVAGAENIRTRSILSIPPVGELLLSVDAWFGRLPLGAQYYTLAQAPGCPHG